MIDNQAVDQFLTTAGKEWIDNKQRKRSFQSCILVLTTNNWSNQFNNVLKELKPFFRKITLSDLLSAPIDWEALSKGDIDDKVFCQVHELRPYQKEALDKVHEYFKANDRGKLIMACGTGKTFTALRIAEHETGSNGFVLFLVPSIALLRQVFLEWSQHSKREMNFLWICSDKNVSRINQSDDEDNYDDSEMPLPATTDVNQIYENLKKYLTKPSMTVVFSTYHSIAVIAKAQAMINKPFDLIICDEAHRTAGIKLNNRGDELFLNKCMIKNLFKATNDYTWLLPH